ncbi:polysaccharide deacetylase family protein [Photobacterium kishitanii]|uniref:polysaccharide deacetylase family protein n=1 Tax=Photobacterium kishitanii TaxID=318456 RepID=UPI0022A9A37D|nr:polysaccharide deacetylase family protein [Photobacterium kishitanii]
MTSLKSVIKNIIPPWVVTYKTAEKGILLTFDDGPDPDITPLILDLLEQYRIHAVFFCAR